MNNLLGLLAIVLILSGCAQTRVAEAKTVRQMHTITIEKSQVIAPNGVDIIELTKRTSSTTDEETGNTINERTEVEQPKIVGQLARVATLAAGVLGGPAAAAAVQVGTSWLNDLLTSGGPAAIAAGAGYLAVRKKNRHFEEVVDGVERAKKVLPKEAWDMLTSELEKSQSRDTSRLVQDRTA